MFVQRNPLALLAASLLTAALSVPAWSAEVSDVKLTTTAMATPPGQFGGTVVTEPVAVAAAGQVAEKVGIGEPTQAIETHSRRMAARAPLEAPLILGVRY